MSNFKPVNKDEIPAATAVGIIALIASIISLGLITTAWLSFVYIKDFQWWAAIATLVAVASLLISGFLIATFTAFFRVEKEFTPIGLQTLLEKEMMRALGKEAEGQPEKEHE